MLIYITLGICGFFGVLLVYRYDLYDREPWWALLIAVAAGAAGMWLIGEIEQRTLSLFGPPLRPPILIATVAATHEELMRLAIVIALAVLLPRIFNDPMDGLVYGSMVGVGMAIDESISFLAPAAGELDALPPAELIRVFGHLIMGGITGFAIGMARIRMRRWPIALLGCLAASMAIHFLWDWIAFVVRDSGAERMHWSQTIAAIALLLSGVMLYGMLVVLASDWSREIFAPHSKRRLWGWPLTFLRPESHESSTPSENP
jgi:RsiW-degrading membrane proteinase PrsW (M82 family)